MVRRVVKLWYELPSDVRTITKLYVVVKEIRAGYGVVRSV